MTQSQIHKRIVWISEKGLWGNWSTHLHKISFFIIMLTNAEAGLMLPKPPLRKMIPGNPHNHRFLPHSFQVLVRITMKTFILLNVWENKCMCISSGSVFQDTVPSQPVHSIYLEILLSTFSKFTSSGHWGLLNRGSEFWLRDKETLVPASLCLWWPSVCGSLWLWQPVTFACNFPSLCWVSSSTLTTQIKWDGLSTADRTSNA